MKDRAAEPPPRHYERASLAPVPLVLLWGVAVVLCGTGLVLAAQPARATASTSAAGILLTAGAIAVIAARKLAEHEIVVTRTSVRAGFGPFARAFACADLRPGASRPATGWRRFYARSELLVEVGAPAGEKVVPLPTDDPGELSAALAPTGAPAGP